MRKGLCLWLMVSEISVHGLLALPLWSRDSAVHHGASVFTMQWPGSKKKDRKVPGPLCSLKGHSLQWPHFLPLDSTTSQVPNLQKEAQSCDQAFKTWNFGGHFQTTLSQLYWFPHLCLTGLPWMSVFNQSLTQSSSLSAAPREPNFVQILTDTICMTRSSKSQRPFKEIIYSLRIPCMLTVQFDHICLSFPL